MGIFDAVQQDISSLRNMMYNTAMTVYAGNVSAKQAEIAHYRAKELQKIQQDWQERMASTAYQRTRKDLEKAGFNPILAVNNGATATGGTGSATGAMADTSMYKDLANSPFMTKIDKAQLRKTNEEIELIKDQQGETSMRTQLYNAQKANAEADTILKDKDANWYEKKWAEMLKEINSKIMLNTQNTALIKAQTENARAEKGLIHENILQTRANTEKTRAEKERTKDLMGTGRNMFDLGSYGKAFTGILDNFGIKHKKSPF